MKRLVCILFLTVSSWTAVAQSSQLGQNNNAPEPEAKLELSTRVIEQRYTVESGSKLERMMLELIYTNVGKRPILLDKKSSLIHTRLVSRNLKDAAAKKYVHAVYSHFISMQDFRVAGFRYEDPPRSEFVKLQPGESYRLNQEVHFSLFDGTKETKDDLRPGKYLLQVRVATWYYFADIEKYSKAWQDDGYLWSRDITSTPMPFTIEKRR